MLRPERLSVGDDAGFRLLGRGTAGVGKQGEKKQEEQGLEVHYMEDMEEHLGLEEKA